MKGFSGLVLARLATYEKIPWRGINLLAFRRKEKDDLMEVAHY